MLIDLTFIHERIMVISIFWSVGGAISNAMYVDHEMANTF